LVGNDYIVIEYNAANDKGSWTDYRRSFDSHNSDSATQPLNWRDSFFPVVYTKEKVAVRICGVHFTDVVSVTTAVNGLPEGGADIRGVAPVTPPASLSSTFDTLQSGVPTGGTTILPGLGLGAPVQAPSMSISGITLGSLGPEDQTPGKYPSYTPASVTASGKQVALLLYSVAMNSREISRLIERTLGKPYPTSDGRISGEATAVIQEEATKNMAEEATKKTLDLAAKQKILEDTTQMIVEESRSAPGSVKGVNYILRLALSRVRRDDSRLSDSVAFDRDMIGIQNVNAQITTLASALSSQSFASNALVLLNNYSALTGVLDLAKLGAPPAGTPPAYCQSNQAYLQTPDLTTLGKDDLAKLTIDSFANWTPAQVLSLNSVEISLLSDKKDEKGRSVQDRVIALQEALSAAGAKKTTTGAGDKPLCSAFERQKLTDFWKSYTDQIGLLISQSNQDDLKCMGSNPVARADDFEGFAGCELIQLNANIDALRAALKSIDVNTSELYDRMNEWNRGSSIEHTDILLPLPQNSDVKVSIVVQRGYTPFTLANANGTITPAVTANVVSTSPGTASTSTPAHSPRILHLQVHRLANFNVVGGAVLIHVPTTTYGVQASTSYAVASTSTPPAYTGTCGGQTVPVPVTATPTAPVSYSCIVRTQQTQIQVSAMAGLAWFPWGHDYYPRDRGYENIGLNRRPSFLLATSVSTLGNSMGGINWEPISGIDFYAGIASAHKTTLPNGLSVNSAVVPGATITQITHENGGFAFGVGLDLSVITSLFSFKGSAAGLP
jgi:hypothetical protein